MEELIERLNKIPNAYFEFIDSVVDYADEKETHLDLIMNYLKNNKLDDFTYNKSLQKICESLRVDKDTKAIIKSMKR